ASPHPTPRSRTPSPAPSSRSAWRPASSSCRPSPRPTVGRERSSGRPRSSCSPSRRQRPSSRYAPGSPPCTPTRCPRSWPCRSRRRSAHTGPGSRNPCVTEQTGVVHAFRDDALGEDDATGLALRLSAGEVSAVELVEAAIARLERVDPRLSAIAYADFDGALRRARSLDKPRGALGGVPALAKETIPVKGMPMAMGSKAMPAHAQAKDGDFTRQLLDTGIVLLGTTQMPEFGWTASTERVGGDVTRNPWNPEYSAGGSSGGSAALVAAGAIPIAHGNDGGGSIRIPAAACGLIGLKPSRGRLRADASDEDLPVRIVADGVLTRSVRDTARFFEAAELSYRNPAL